MNLEKLFTEENVGGWDLFLRALIGSAGTIALAMNLITLTEPWNWLAGLIIFIALFTSITRHCTPYGLIRMNTARKK